MRSTFRLVPALAFVLLLAACSGNEDTGGLGTETNGTAGDPSPSLTASPGGTDDSGSNIEVELEEQNGSGIRGSAQIVQVSANTISVTLTLTGAGAGPQPAHIHPGTCAELNPQPKYPLQDVSNGTSTTEVAVGLEELTSGEFAINVHKSAAEAQVYVACGDIKSS